MSDRLKAITDSVPAGLGYLTDGKAYDILEDDGRLFTIVDDQGDEIDCLWEGCAHLDGGNWSKAA